MEAGYAWQSVTLSGAVEYENTIDTAPARSEPTVPLTDIVVPFRVRFLGLGSPGRFYVLAGVVYSVLWDRTRQAGATSDGSALRSAGSVLELGACYRFPIAERLSLELGIAPRAIVTRAANGIGYFAEAGFQHYSLPIYVSVPYSL